MMTPEARERLAVLIQERVRPWAQAVDADDLDALVTDPLLKDILAEFAVVEKGPPMWIVTTRTKRGDEYKVLAEKDGSIFREYSSGQRIENVILAVKEPAQPTPAQGCD